MEIKCKNFNLIKCSHKCLLLSDMKGNTYNKITISLKTKEFLFKLHKRELNTNSVKIIVVLI